MEIVRAFFQAWNAGDMEALRELYHPEVIVRSPEGWPEPGPFLGPEAFMRQLEQQRETWDAGALEVMPSTMFASQMRQLVELAAKSRLPAIFPDERYAQAGGLLSYGPSFPEMYRRAATYVDKILKGAKPGDLPVEQPMRFEFIINLKAAKQIGLTIPPNVLVRADKVIK